jgi:hypothetical protein
MHSRESLAKKRRQARPARVRNNQEAGGFYLKSNQGYKTPDLIEFHPLRCARRGALRPLTPAAGHVHRAEPKRAVLTLELISRDIVYQLLKLGRTQIAANHFKAKPDFLIEL